MELAQQKARGWQVFGRSVRGASHERSGLPNQDSIGWLDHPLLLSVADGHGSPKCFRSEQGARFAVETAQAVLGELPDDIRRPGALQALPVAIVEMWRQKVEAHWNDHPPSESRWNALERKMGRAARLSIEADPYLAYGSTLLAAAITGDSVLYLQLGDGDILIVSDGDAVTRPWPRDPRLLGNETPSLAGSDPAGEIQIRVTSSAEPFPSLILLATDGYSNSFREETGFLEVGADLIRMLRAEGLAPIRDHLESWLQEASELGSGDDVTVGLLWFDNHPCAGA